MNCRTILSFVFLLLLALPASAQGEALQQKLDRLIEQLNDADNLALQSTGDQISELGADAIPLVKMALENGKLSWVAMVALRHGMESLEDRQAGRLVPQRVAARLAWYRKHMVEAYKKFGHRDPKWDADVIEGLDRTARSYAGDPTFDEGIGYGIVGLLNSPIEKGCEDPMVHYALVMRFLTTNQYPNQRRLELFEKAAQGFTRYDYHPYFQIAGLIKINVYRLDKNDRLLDPEARKRQVEMNEHIAKTLLPRLVADKELPPQALLTSIGNSVTGRKRINNDRARSFEEVAAIVREHVAETDLLTARGAAMVAAAWDARGTDVAANVPAAAWKIYHMHIKDAQLSLHEAIRLDPTNSAAACEMITVHMAMSHPRAQMERTFLQAMNADPGNYAACSAKWQYLLPRWHGTFEELRQFARQCLLTGNWEGGVPLVLLDIHHHLSTYDQRGQWMRKVDPDYYARPGIWPEVQIVCEGHLRRFPKDRLMHQRYAQLAISARQWDIAHRELTAGGNWPDYRIFTTLNKEAFDKLKADVAQRANAQ